MQTLQRELTPTQLILPFLLSYRTFHKHSIPRELTLDILNAAMLEDFKAFVRADRKQLD